MGLLPLLLPVPVRGYLLASEWRRTVGVSEHRMERSGKGVGEGTAVVFLRHGYKAGESDKQQQEQLKGKSCPEDPEEEGSAHPCGLGFRKGGIVATFCGPKGKIDINNSTQIHDGLALVFLALVPFWDTKDHAKYNPIWY